MTENTTAITDMELAARIVEDITGNWSVSDSGEYPLSKLIFNTGRLTEVRTSQVPQYLSRVGTGAELANQVWEALENLGFHTHNKSGTQRVCREWNDERCPRATPPPLSPLISAWKKSAEELDAEIHERNVSGESQQKIATALRVHPSRIYQRIQRHLARGG